MCRLGSGFHNTLLGCILLHHNAFSPLSPCPSFYLFTGCLHASVLTMIERVFLSRALGGGCQHSSSSRKVYSTCVLSLRPRVSFILGIAWWSHYLHVSVLTKEGTPGQVRGGAQVYSSMSTSCAHEQCLQRSHKRVCGPCGSQLQSQDFSCPIFVEPFIGPWQLLQDPWCLACCTGWTSHPLKTKRMRLSRERKVEQLRKFCMRPFNQNGLGWVGLINHMRSWWYDRAAYSLLPAR